MAAGHYLTPDDARRLRDDHRRIRGGKSVQHGPRYDRRPNTPHKVTFGRAQEFIGVGGPFSPVENIVGLLYGGGYALSDEFFEDLWYGETPPEDLGLWGVGALSHVVTRTAAVYDEGEPVLDEGEPVYDTTTTTVGPNFLAINLTGRWIWAASLCTILNGRYIVNTDAPRLIVEHYTKTGGTPTQVFYAADGQQVTDPSFDATELSRAPLTMPSSYSVNDPFSTRSSTIAGLGTGETAQFLHTTGRTTVDSVSSALSLTCIGPSGDVTVDGSEVIAFRLTEDKSYADVEALAKPINTDGTLNSGADAFHVVDHEGQFYGLAAYTDGDTAATAHPGYLGHAVRYTDDYAEGVPGYRIINMEGPEHFILVELKSVVSSGSATCDFMEGGDLPAGGGDSARRPRIEHDDYDVTVYDDLGVAADAEIGDDWIAVWDRDDEHYIFLKPLENANYYIRIKGTPDDAVTADDTEFTCTTYDVLQGREPTGELSIENVAKIPISDSETVEFQWNETEGQWETVPRVCHRVRGLAVGAVASSDDTFDIDNISLICGSDPRTDPSSSAETLEIDNQDFEFAIDDNGVVKAELEADGVWRAYQARCPAPEE